MQMRNAIWTNEKNNMYILYIIHNVHNVHIICTFSKIPFRIIRFWTTENCCLFGCFHPRSVCVLVSLIRSVLLDATPSRVSIKTVPTTRCRQAYLDKCQEKLLHKQTNWKKANHCPVCSMCCNICFFGESVFCRKVPSIKDALRNLCLSIGWVSRQKRWEQLETRVAEENQT